MLKAQVTLSTTSVHKHRALCLRCLRPETTCYCREVHPIRSRFQFVLLQHPLEHRNCIGTARMTHHCLENSKLILGTEFDDNQQVRELLANPDNYCVVLYPGKNSVNISLETTAETESRFPVGKNWVIFVIDGTWFCAKKMLRRSPMLSLLPQICFSPKTESEYKIRQQPHPQCLSTIEAVHYLIETLDPHVDPANLLEVFRGMVARQLKFFDSKGH
ncbi:MAG: tRNA-uridine aminocarboxypropyltransferase [Bdellovibrionia bacterium]